MATTLREAFPYLDHVPPSVGFGISLDRDISTLQPHELVNLIPAIVQHLLANEHQKLAALLTDLGRVRDFPVAPSIRNNRSRNALSRARVHTWGDLGEFSTADLRRLSGIGTRTLKDILRCCVECVVFGEPGDSRRAYTGHENGALKNVVESIQILCAWASRERKIVRLEDLLQLASDISPLPSDLDELWHDLINHNPAALAPSALTEVTLEQIVSDLLGSLTDTQRVVYEHRVLSERPATLEEIGQELGFTRERARQIQISALNRIESLLASQRFRPLLWRASELRSALGRAVPKENQITYDLLARCLSDVSSSARWVVERILLCLAGPYRYRNGWLELVDAPELTADELASSADQNGLLPLADACDWLSMKGIQPIFHNAWLEWSGRFRQFGPTLVVWSGSVVDKSVAILALRGKPADAETLVAEVGEGHSWRTAQNGFLGDDRLVRVSRSHWALRSWGLEEYTGITDEIAQRINAAGGRVRLTSLVEDLVQQFGVREVSVKAYAEAPMFVLEDGWVRLRGEAEPITIQQDFVSCKGVYRSSSEVISILVPVDRETLRGSGRWFQESVAAVMGVVPGHARTFTWEGGELSVNWPKTSAFGPTLGSTRGLALATEAQEGDYLRFDFNLVSSRVRCERIPPSLQGIPPSEALRLLTGIDGGAAPAESIALALRVAPSDVRRRLIERGDSMVAELLPPPVLDRALELALSDLAELLEKQG